MAGAAKSDGMDYCNETLGHAGAPDLGSNMRGFLPRVGLVPLVPTD